MYLKTIAEQDATGRTAEIYQALKEAGQLKDDTLVATVMSNLGLKIAIIGSVNL